MLFLWDSGCTAHIDVELEGEQNGTLRPTHGVDSSQPNETFSVATVQFDAMSEASQLPRKSTVHGTAKLAAAQQI